MAKVIRKDLEAKLQALNGAEWDSMSEDEVSDNDIVAEIVDSTATKDNDATVAISPLHAQHRKVKAKRGKGAAGESVVPVGPKDEPSGVIYIGHIPHGFYEEAMNGFFGQFGDVVRVRLSRSKKSGRCKGYAYVEFSSPEVAGIVASTMHGYFLYDKQLVCRVLKFGEIHPNLFDGAGREFRKINWHGMYRKKRNADRTAEKDEKHTQKLLKKDDKKRKQLAALGIEYDFSGFVATLKDREVADEPVQPKTLRDGDKVNVADTKKNGNAGRPAAGDSIATTTESDMAVASSEEAETAAEETKQRGKTGTSSAKKVKKKKSSEAVEPGKADGSSAKKAKKKKSSETAAQIETETSSKKSPETPSKSASKSAGKKSPKIPSQSTSKSSGKESPEASSPASMTTLSKKSPKTQSRAATKTSSDKPPKAKTPSKASRKALSQTGAKTPDKETPKVPPHTATKKSAKKSKKDTPAPAQETPSTPTPVAGDEATSATGDGKKTKTSSKKKKTPKTSKTAADGSPGVASVSTTPTKTEATSKGSSKKRRAQDEEGAEGRAVTRSKKTPKSSKRSKPVK